MSDNPTPARSTKHTAGETPAKRQMYTERTALTEREAAAASLLKDDGWTLGELRMMFEASNSTILRAIDVVEVEYHVE